MTILKVMTQGVLVFVLGVCFAALLNTTMARAASSDVWQAQSIAGTPAPQFMSQTDAFDEIREHSEPTLDGEPLSVSESNAYAAVDKFLGNSSCGPTLVSWIPARWVTQRRARARQALLQWKDELATQSPFAQVAYDQYVYGLLHQSSPWPSSQKLFADEKDLMGFMIERAFTSGGERALLLKIALTYSR